MTQTTARIKQKGKNFEIVVDLDSAIKLKKENSGSISQILEIDEVFTDHKKGLKASEKDLKECFGTEDVYQIAEKIVKSGEVLLTQDYRDEEREKRLKQIVDYLVRNSQDPKTGRPHTPDRIKTAIDQSGINITNKPIDSQINEIIDKISMILPLKIQTKRIKIVIPAQHTGKAYGIITSYKVSEDWLSNGNLEVVVEIPAGAVMEFYDKLNSVTHGSAITEEMKE